MLAVIGGQISGHRVKIKLANHTFPFSCDKPKACPFWSVYRNSGTRQFSWDTSLDWLLVRALGVDGDGSAGAAWPHAVMTRHSRKTAIPQHPFRLFNDMNYTRLS